MWLIGPSDQAPSESASLAGEGRRPGHGMAFTHMYMAISLRLYERGAGGPE